MGKIQIIGVVYILMIKKETLSKKSGEKIHKVNGRSKEEEMICPLKRGSNKYCTKDLCSWYLPGEKVCALVGIAMELMRGNERGDK